jgi:hypothetical protein
VLLENLLFGLAMKKQILHKLGKIPIAVVDSM